MSSQKSSEIDPSRLNDTSNTTANFPVETPDGTQSSPGFTLSATRPINPLKNGSYNTLQGNAPFSEDNQSLGQTLPEDSAWSIQTGGDNTHSLPSAPPPTETNCVIDSIGSFWSASDGSVWPLSPTDTNWQLEFDLPFTAEPNSAFTGATSSALSELDLAQVYNQSTQCCDYAGVSKELIEYLRLDEKVSTDATTLV